MFLDLLNVSRFVRHSEESNKQCTTTVLSVNTELVNAINNKPSDCHYLGSAAVKFRISQ